LGGRRAFHDLSAGETAAHDLSWECGGGKNPPWISRRKDQVGDSEPKKRPQRHAVSLLRKVKGIHPWSSACF